MADNAGNTDLGSPGSTNPSSADIIAMLGKMNLTLIDMGKRLDTLGILERKVDNFDKELRKLWWHIDATSKATNDKVDRAEARMDSAEINLDGARRL